MVIQENKGFDYRFSCLYTAKMAIYPQQHTFPPFGWGTDNVALVYNVRQYILYIVRVISYTQHNENISNELAVPIYAFIYSGFKRSHKRGRHTRCVCSVHNTFALFCWPWQNRLVWKCCFGVGIRFGKIKLPVQCAVSLRWYFADSVLQDAARLYSYVLKCLVRDCNTETL